jgi:hypothetical protein
MIARPTLEMGHVGDNHATHSKAAKHGEAYATNSLAIRAVSLRI